MSLQEAKELFGMLIFSSLGITIVFLLILSKFAEITYKKAHSKKTHKVAHRKENIVYNIENTKNMTLQEIQDERRKMYKEIYG